MRTLDDLVRAGKIRHAGLSDVPAWYASRAQTLAEWRGYEPVSALQLEYSLVERNIEREFTDLGTQHGMGIMVWSPLGSGLLSGKYRPSQDGGTGDGRLEAVKGSDVAAFDKFKQRNWEIVSELEAVSKAVSRSMAQVALNWVANRPGVASVILGATKLSQLNDNMDALSFAIPDDLKARLDAVSAPPVEFPYSYFRDNQQARIAGGVATGLKPRSYFPAVEVPAVDVLLAPVATKR
jgi:aryl-alcohol dehydrogenase-like predicted oxidoreductase